MELNNEEYNVLLQIINGATFKGIDVERISLIKAKIELKIKEVEK